MFSLPGSSSLNEFCPNLAVIVKGPSHLCASFLDLRSVGLRFLLFNIIRSPILKSWSRLWESAYHFCRSCALVICSLAILTEFAIFLIISSAAGTMVFLLVKSIANSGFFPYISSKGVKPDDSLGVELMANSADGR